MPGNVEGYVVFSKTRKYLIFYDGMLGATGISANYSLVVILNLKNKDHINGYAAIVPFFSINDVGDFNMDSKLDLR